MDLLISNFFVPTGLFSMLSLISLIIKPDHGSERMGIVVTILLITTTIYISADAPPNRGISFIEIWILGCEIPIVTCVLEYGWILMLSRSKGAAAVIDCTFAMEGSAAGQDCMVMVQRILYQRLLVQYQLRMLHDLVEMWEHM